MRMYSIVFPVLSTLDSVIIIRKSWWQTGILYDAPTGEMDGHEPLEVRVMGILNEEIGVSEEDCQYIGNSNEKISGICSTFIDGVYLNVFYVVLKSNTPYCKMGRGELKVFKFKDLINPFDERFDGFGQIDYFIRLIYEDLIVARVNVKKEDFCDVK